MGRDVQWREAVVRLLVAARPMTMAARAVSGESALRALSEWGRDAWGDAHPSRHDVEVNLLRVREDSPTDRERRALREQRENRALERVTPISLVGRRPMGVRSGSAERAAPGSPMARRPRETATWRERWPDVPAVRGTRGALSR